MTGVVAVVILGAIWTSSPQKGDSQSLQSVILKNSFEGQRLGSASEAETSAKRAKGYKKLEELPLPASASSTLSSSTKKSLGGGGGSSPSTGAFPRSASMPGPGKDEKGECLAETSNPNAGTVLVTGPHNQQSSAGACLKSCE